MSQIEPQTESHALAESAEFKRVVEERESALLDAKRRIAEELERARGARENALTAARALLGQTADGALARALQEIASPDWSAQLQSSLAAQVSAAPACAAESLSWQAQAEKIMSNIERSLETSLGRIAGTLSSTSPGRAP